MAAKHSAANTVNRLYQRVSLMSDLSVTYEGTSELVPVRPPDLSPEGMFINTPAYFAQGAVLKLRFRLGRSGFEVSTRAEVRYCLAGVGIGVEFLDLSPEARNAIAQDVSAAAVDLPADD